MTTPAAPMPQYPFDTRPLTEPIDPAAVKKFARDMNAQYGRPGGSALMIVILCVAAVMIVFPVLITIGFAIFAAPSTKGVSSVVLVPILVVLVVAAVVTPLVIAGLRRSRVSAYRIARFANANGMSYKHQVTDPPLPGMIFHRGDGRTASLVVRGERPRFVEFGNYVYSTGSGKSRTTHNWGYIAVKLDVPLPNIVLDALGNNTLGSNLPASFSKDQRLSLEGDFDRYFTLYCPAGYEADALYLFTPDIMARFITHAAQMDVEIVEDWMFLYMQRPASTLDAATWAWLFGTIGALMSKFDQWARWRDDRLRQAHMAAPQHPVTAGGAPIPGALPVPGAVPMPVGAPGPAGAPAPALPFAAPAGMLTPPPGVALPGRRLKQRGNWVVFIIVGAVFLAVSAPMFLGMIAAIFGVLFR